MAISSVLVVVPCGFQKIWDRNPALGSILAKEAYTSIPFKLNRAFAERFGTTWVILSAKYGFISPERKIERYNATFKSQKTGPISLDRLYKQVQEQKLGRFATLIGLGGKEYRAAVAVAFAGLPIGKVMQAIKRELK